MKKDGEREREREKHFKNTKNKMRSFGLKQGRRNWGGKDFKPQQNLV